MKLSYEERGTGKPGLFFVHGNSLSSKTFAGQLSDPELGPYRKVAIDLPGHGRSPRLDGKGGYDFTLFTGVLVDTVRALGMEDAVFVGNSLGGHLLLEAARRLPHARGFVLSGTPPLGKPPDLAAAFLPTPVAGAFFKGPLAAEEIAACAAMVAAPGATPPRFLEEIIRSTDPAVRDGLARELAGGGLADERAVVENLEVPLAILHGEHDPLVRLPYLKGLRAPTLWRGAPQVIVGSGHLPQLDHPSEFNRLLKEFLTSLPR